MAGHLAQEAVLAGPGDAHQQRPALVDAAADHLVAFLLLRGHRLPRHDGLVDRARPLVDHAVHRDAITRAHAHKISDRHLFDGDFFFPAVPDHPRGGRLHLEETAHALRRLGPHDQRDVAGEQVVGGEKHHHAEEVDRREAFEAVPVEEGHRRAEHAADVAADGPHREQHVLVGDAAPSRSPGHADDAPPVPDEDIGGDGPGGPGVPRLHLPQIQPHRRHGEQHGEGESSRRDKIVALLTLGLELLAERADLARVAHDVA